MGATDKQHDKQFASKQVSTRQWHCHEAGTTYYEIAWEHHILYKCEASILNQFVKTRQYRNTTLVLFTHGKRRMFWKFSVWSILLMSLACCMMSSALVHAQQESTRKLQVRGPWDKKKADNQLMYWKESQQDKKIRKATCYTTGQAPLANLKSDEVGRADGFSHVQNVLGYMIYEWNRLSWQRWPKRSWEVVKVLRVTRLTAWSLGKVWNKNDVANTLAVRGWIAERLSRKALNSS